MRTEVSRVIDVLDLYQNGTLWARMTHGKNQKIPVSDLIRIGVKVPHRLKPGEKSRRLRLTVKMTPRGKYMVWGRFNVRQREGESAPFCYLPRYFEGKRVSITVSRV